MSNVNRIIRQYFSQPYSKNIRKQFAAWFKSDKSKEEKEEVLRNIWDELHVEADYQTEQSFRKLQAKISKPADKYLPSFHGFWRVAAMLALPFLSATITWAYMKSGFSFIHHPVNTEKQVAVEKLESQTHTVLNVHIEEDVSKVMQNFRFTVSPSVANTVADTWYYMNFTDVFDFTVTDIINDTVRTAFPQPNRDEQCWKIVWIENSGNTDYYTLVNKTYGQLRFDLWYSDPDNEVGFYTTELQYPVALFSITELPSAGYGGGYQLLRKGRQVSVVSYVSRTDYSPIGARLSENNSNYNKVDFVLPENMIYPSNLFSTAEEPVWYYIEFVETLKALQDNGADTRLTAKAMTRGNDAQLWRIEYAGRSGGGQLASGAYNIINKATGNKICYRFRPSGGMDLPEGAGFYATDRDTVVYSGTERICDVAISGTLLNNGNGAVTVQGFLIHGNYNTSNDSISRHYFLTSDALSNETGRNAAVNNSVISFVPASTSYVNKVKTDGTIVSITVYNISGQLVRCMKPNSSVADFMNELSCGAYIVQIQKTTGMEVTKFIKR
ncbi:MAG: T9SS type A sorting domain-containing protein [Dysgonamonadaceae bacterium]|jgi:hypothetical protein|nr:T9SS type A sorting domain-containing protein [Dysgonamonadaceae bacterium]